MTVAVDFDGTVANTMPALEELAVELAGLHTGRTEEELRTWYRGTAGMPFTEQVVVLGRYPMLVADFMQQKVSITIESKPWEDVGKLAGIPANLVLVSSTTNLLLERYLARWELEHLFKYVEGWADGYSKTQQLMDSEARDFIGDSERDRTYARWAGVTFHGVRRNDGYLLGTAYADLGELVAAQWPVV